MSMSKDYFFNEETKEAVVSVYYKGRKSIARAKLHPEDEEFGNEFTGYAIAEYRAEQKAHHRVCVDLKERIRRAKAEVVELERQLSVHKDSMKSLELAEIDFIEQKEKFYQKVRETRDPEMQKQRAERLEAVKSMMKTMNDKKENKVITVEAE